MGDTPISASSMDDFAAEVAARIAANSGDTELIESARAFMLASIGAQYSYNFSWLGRSIIQYPQDMVALQEIIWKARPLGSGASTQSVVRSCFANRRRHHL